MHWLHQVMVESRGPAQLTVVLVAPAGDRHQEEAGTIGVPAQVEGHVEPVPFRHAEVDQEQRGVVLIDRGERRIGAVLHPHRRAVKLEERAQRHRGIPIVIDDQNSERDFGRGVSAGQKASREGWYDGALYTVNATGDLQGRKAAWGSLLR